MNEKGELSFATLTAHQLTPPAEAVGAAHIYRVGNGVTAPKITQAPDPDSTEEARRAKFAGECVFWIVVNKAGKVENVDVMRPLGWGLDEAAAEVVTRWSFEPAKLKGEPVSVAINVDMTFGL